MPPINARGTQSPVRAAPMSEHDIESAVTASFGEDTLKPLRMWHSTAWHTTRFERSLRLPASSMARRAMMLWITDTLTEWSERHIDTNIDAWCDVIARDHHRVARLPGRPVKALDWMSRHHQTPVEAMQGAVAKLLRALDVFRSGDVISGRIDGLTVFAALRDYERTAATRRPAPIPAHDVPLSTGRLMARHGGTATIELATVAPKLPVETHRAELPPVLGAPPERSHGPTGKPRTEPDAFDADWCGHAQPADAEPEAPTRPPRWRYRKPA